MKIVKIKGGIGNQLFQYAFALNIKKKLKEEVKLDFSSCYGCSDKTCEDRLKLFSITLPEASVSEIKSVRKFYSKSPLLTFKYKVATFMDAKFNKRYFFEKERKYLDNIDYTNTYFDGYWQSWKYVYFVNNELKESLIPSYELNDKTKTTISKIEKENSVFIGIRRGDYVSTKSARDRYGSFSKEYYLNAMNYISSKIENPVFYVFTNDVPWCKNNLDFSKFNVVYREKEDQVSDFEELIIMSRCKHAIILNSTFHWWGAYLIENPNKIVIAPKCWYTDGTDIEIVPEDWIKMERDGKLIL